jgi:hypothetical protein
MSISEIYEAMTRLLGFGAVIHAAEFLMLRQRIEKVWRWSDLEPELGKIFRPALSNRGFLILNIGRFVAGITAMTSPGPIVVWILLGLHLLTLLRWLGTFNGGSDYMTFLLLWTCALGFSLPSDFGLPCLYYIVFQLCLSYFRAGFVKFKNPQWHSGQALDLFLNSPVYAADKIVAAITSRPTLLRWSARFIILFEVTFPLSVFHPKIALVYMALGFGFHLVNAYVFGLNRFLWAWLAAYPALYYVSLFR